MSPILGKNRVNPISNILNAEFKRKIKIQPKLVCQRSNSAQMVPVLPDFSNLCCLLSRGRVTISDQQTMSRRAGGLYTALVQST